MERKLHMKIGGMFCVNCASRIEKKLAGEDGVRSVTADYRSGSADILYEENTISYETMASLVESLDYEVLSATPQGMTPLLRSILLLAVILALFVILQLSGALKLLAPGRLADTGMGYGMLFMIGLITSLHCIAMCGGINLSQSLTGNSALKESENNGGEETEAGQDRAAQAASGRQKLQAFLPSLMYNLGRVCSYTAIGLILGTIGFLIGGGGQLGISSLLQGIIKIIAGVFMILMGISMLNLFPGVRKLIPRMPKGLAIGLFQGTRQAKGSFVVGLLNGIMPCGPLQAMWFVALASANPFAGALSMFLFSLGTVPLMLGFGSIVAALGKKFSRIVLTAGAILVVVMGIAMLSQGGMLSGLFSIDSLFGGAGQNVARMENGVQVVSSTLEPGSYPEITVRAGIPVRWEIEAPEGSVNGCNYRIVIPAYGMDYTFETGTNVIEFTPEEAGEVGYHCWMGMIYGSIIVTE